MEIKTVSYNLQQSTHLFKCLFGNEQNTTEFREINIIKRGNGLYLLDYSDFTKVRGAIFT